MSFRGYSLLRPRAGERFWPILIFLLVRFHLLVFGKAERICSGGKTSGLFQVLASEANSIGSRRLGRLLPNSTSSFDGQFPRSFRPRDPGGLC